MTDDDLKRLFEETQRRFDVVAEDLRSEVRAAAEESRATNAETRHLFSVVTKDLRSEVRAVAEESRAATAETRHLFSVVTEDLRSEIRLVAEGVHANTERIDHLRSEMKEEFIEVRSMIKFSYAELDRRIRTLEEGFADLQGRVERLETSTH